MSSSSPAWAREGEGDAREGEREGDHDGPVIAFAIFILVVAIHPFSLTMCAINI